MFRIAQLKLAIMELNDKHQINWNLKVVQNYDSNCINILLEADDRINICQVVANLPKQEYYLINCVRLNSNCIELNDDVEIEV